MTADTVQRGLAAQLAQVVGPDHVLTDHTLTASYETDWTGRYTGRARLVVRPATPRQVAEVVELCAAAGAAMVPQGGNTGLVGGGVPRDGEVVVSCRRLDRIEPVDVLTSQVTVGAGVTLGALQRRLRPLGLDFGVDFAARDSATVGGMVATNAGGERVLRYGAMRANVVGVEAVLANGRVLSRLTGLVKDNVGYDLGSLLVGSEGTLAVVTRARLRLVPLLAARAAALVALADLEAAVATLSALRTRVPSLEAVELVFHDGLELVCAHAGLARPFPDAYPVYVLAECAGRDDPTDELAAALTGLAEVRDAAVAAGGPGHERLWRYREEHTAAINARGVPLKLDVAVPLTALATFERRLRELVGEVAPDAHLYVFGHLAEGNLHVNVLGAGDRAPELTRAVLGLVVGAGGSISAEHGVGRAKAGWVGLSRSPTEIAAMQAVKHALDPRGLLNPGVLFPVEGTQEAP